MIKSLEFYQSLGFFRTFDDSGGDLSNMSYTGVRRDNICLHLQKMSDSEDPTAPQLRIQVKKIDNLYQELQNIDCGESLSLLEEKPWESRDFVIYDPDTTDFAFFEDV